MNDSAVAVDTRPAAPAQRLEDAFRAIHASRMQGLPFVNDALQVEAIGFRRWEGRWLGVLLTPWFMNLVLLPDEPDKWQSVPVRGSCSYAFPAGVFDFIAGFEDGVGEFQSCSLFSPVFEFAQHEVARATAQASLAALFEASSRAGVEGPTDRPVERDPALEGDPAASPAPSGAQPATDADRAARAVSKRDFLRGRWSGSRRAEPGAGS
jgi:[NiFe] hydrogenase assembly HybE family chaperone